MAASGVVGAGVMGRGIVQLFASAGHQLRLFDADPAAVAAAIAFVGGMIERQVSKGTLAAEGAADIAGRLGGSLDERKDVEHGVSPNVKSRRSASAVRRCRRCRTLPVAGSRGIQRASPSPSAGYARPRDEASLAGALQLRATNHTKRIRAPRNHQ